MKQENIIQVLPLWLHNGKDSLLINDDELYGELEWDYNYFILEWRPITLWDARNKLYYDQDGYISCYDRWGARWLIIVNRKLKNKLLEELEINKEKEQVQFFEIPLVWIEEKERVQWKTLREMEEMWVEMKREYYAMNILNIWSGMDMIDESRTWFWFSLFNIATFYREKLPVPYDFFRLNHGDFIYYISERVWKIIKKLDSEELETYLENNRDKLRVKRAREAKNTLLGAKHLILEWKRESNSVFDKYRDKMQTENWYNFYMLLYVLRLPKGVVIKRKITYNIESILKVLKSGEYMDVLEELEKILTEEEKIRLKKMMVDIYDVILTGHSEYCAIEEIDENKWFLENGYIYPKKWVKVYDMIDVMSRAPLDLSYR